MKKNTWMFFSIIAALLVASLLFAGKSESSLPEPVNNTNTACTKIKLEDCLKKQKNNVPGEMMESLSRQFLFISPFSR